MIRIVQDENSRVSGDRPSKFCIYLLTKDLSKPSLVLAAPF